MKKQLIIIATCLLITACSDFLEVDPPYTQDAENYFERPEDYERALIGAYDLLQGSFLNIWIGEIASDNAIAGGESVTDTEGLHEIENMTHDAVNNELRSIWRWNYAGLTRANYILEFKDKIDFEGKDQIIAESKFLRAYYYFQLVKFFGDVPLILDKRLGAQEAKKIDRTPKDQVYSQIEGDLRDASAILPSTQIIKGKITKGAALSLLGKILLYQNKFEQAASALDTVIQSKLYTLIDDYDKIFSVANEGHSETVFDIEYSGLEGGSYECLICLEGNAAPGFQGIRQYKGPVYGDGNSYNLPTKDLYEYFEASDPRRDATILNLDEFISKQSNPEQIEYAKGAGGHTGFYNNKYIKKQGEIGLPDNDLTSPVNFKVIRYADVLLMAAEAHNRKSSPDDARALEYLNTVRKRVGMADKSSNGSDLTQDIWNERRLELSGEGLRFFDLVRTGQAEIEMDNFIPGKHELFPIPQVEIDLAGGNWQQNPNY